VNEHDHPGFDDPGFDEVRALLADARVTEPVPDDVAARLDATLASLQAERAAASAPPSGAGHPDVVPLRQRLRRGAGRVLVAAAVVAVVGAGGVRIAQLVGDSSGGSADSATSADRAQESGGSGSTGTAPEAPGEVKDAPQAASGARPVPALTTAAFAADAARVMTGLAGEQTAQLASKGATPGPTGDLDTRSPAAGYDAAGAPPVTATPRDRTDSLLSLDACAGPAAPDAVTVPATLDGGRVALVFRPPTDSGQRVEAWSCDGGTLLQAATVPTTPPS
jgi:hypothetical protein